MAARIGQLVKMAEAISDRSGRLYDERLAATAELFNEALGDHLALEVMCDLMGGTRLFTEASTDDYPNLFGDVLQRELTARYNAFQDQVWLGICRRRVVNDFRSVKSFHNDSINQVVVKQADDAAGGGSGSTRYKADAAAVSWAVDIYDAHTTLNWKALRNDDLGKFADIPQNFAEAARHGENKFATGLWYTTTGPRLGGGTTGLTGVASNPVLGTAGLKAAITALWSATDPQTGMPILLRAPILEVPPGLVVDARELIQATALEIKTTTDVAAGTNLVTQNWINDFVGNVKVNPWIPKIATSNQTTCWCLHANAAVGAASCDIGFLRGAEAPAIYTKAPDRQRVGGGLDASRGSFTTGEFEWKVEHVFGGVLRDGSLSQASTGAAS